MAISNNGGRFPSCGAVVGGSRGFNPIWPGRVGEGNLSQSFQGEECRAEISGRGDETEAGRGEENLGSRGQIHKSISLSGQEHGYCIAKEYEINNQLRILSSNCRQRHTRKINLGEQDVAEWSYCGRG